MNVSQKRVLGTAAYIGRKMVMEEFCWSWGQMIQYTNEFMVGPNEFVHWERNKKYGQAGARNWLSQHMMGSWLFMSDSDHIFEPDLLYRMVTVLEQFKLDVLTGLYLYDESPKLPVIYKRVNGNPTNIHLSREFMKVDATMPLKRIKIDVAGAGCLLIRRSVIERIDKELHELPFTPILPEGEDFSFFQRLGLLGIDAWCCPNIESQHLCIEPATLSDYEMSKGYGQKVVPAILGMPVQNVQEDKPDIPTVRL